MATVAWDTFLPIITPDIPGCPHATIELNLAATVADFCARTHIWRAPLDLGVTQADTSIYPVFNTSHVIIESVLWLLVDNRKLEHTDPRLINPEDLTRTGQPTHFWIENDKNIRLFFTPDDAYTLSGEVALKPSRQSCGVEDWIYETWADAIVSGVIYRITRTPGKEWSSPDMAAAHKSLYEQGVTNARIRDRRNVHMQVRMIKP
jgi:hypothetical protein